jgi:glycosyltransferase involved in cell wall biosynthesis
MNRSKVSMVVPCYNKEKYIGAMLESVCRQVWDNIELILVNDGSTDGTRGIIAEWEPKLRRRGYEVVIVDQENAGCCAAVYAGLLRMTGEYYCLVDCDDEIMPEYVSRMAGWLCAHEEYEAASCNYAMFKGTLEHQIPIRVTQPICLPDEGHWLENFLLCRTHTPVWLYMVRRPYADRMLATFCTERRRTYEPLIAIPLASGGGKIKYFKEAMYKFNLYANGFIGMQSYEQAKAYYEDYEYLHRWVIEKLDTEYKERLMLFGRLGCLKKLTEYAIRFEITGSERALLFSDIRLTAGKLNQAAADIPDEKIAKASNYFFRAITDAVMGVTEDATEIKRPKGRVIGLGALGKAASIKIPLLRGSVLQPSELWDNAANSHSTVDGIAVRAPSYDTLKADDLILVFPSNKNAAAEIQQQLDNKKAASIMWSQDIEDRLPVLCFPNLQRFYVE